MITIKGFPLASRAGEGARGEGIQIDFRSHPIIKPTLVRAGLGGEGTLIDLWCLVFDNLG